MRRIICVLMLLAFTGCTSVAKGVKVGIQTSSVFNAIVLKDVQQSMLLAEAGDDPLALKCWTYLEKFTVENAPSGETAIGEVVGVFSAYQKARNARRNVVEVKLSDQFRLECGPLFTDAIEAIELIGAKISF